MNRHQRLLKDAENAIESVFSDTSVGQATTLEDLKDLREQIDFKIECIEADLRRAK